MSTDHQETFDVPEAEDRPVPLGARRFARTEVRHTSATPFNVNAFGNEYSAKLPSCRRTTMSQRSISVRCFDTK